MMAFDVLFPDLARRESRALRPVNDPDLPDATFLFLEHYCAERGCDCRRVVLAVWWAERRKEVASINYSFEPARPPFDDEPQTFLDPLNTQSEHSEGLLALFEKMMTDDPSYRERLVRHYEMWKAVVDDPAHPDHPKVRSESHDDPSIRPAFPRLAPARREGAKVGANDPCPCGSGKKHKKCCRA